MRVCMYVCIYTHILILIEACVVEHRKNFVGVWFGIREHFVGICNIVTVSCFVL